MLPSTSSPAAEHAVSKPVEASWPNPIPPKINIAIVGEAPGADEVLNGKPFVGSSGHLLNELLVRAGIERASCLVTNVFRFKPPGNDVSHFFVKKLEANRIIKEKNWVPMWPASGDRGYCRQEWEGEVTRLLEELRRAKPNVVVALGAIPLWALTGHTEISKMRGVTLPIDLGQGITTKLVASYHPAYVLRQYDWKPILGMDLVKAKLNSSFPEIRRVTRNLWVQPTLADLKTFREKYIDTQCGPGKNPLTFDIETDRKTTQMTCIGFAPSPSEAIIVPFILSNYRSYWKSSDEEVAALNWCRSLLEDPSITKLAQNGSYDRTWLARRYGIWLAGPYHDTLHLHHAMEPELPKDLATLAALYTDEPTAWKLLAPHQTNKDDE